MSDANYPFFSVIIPVYNVEKYLEDCIQSILANKCDSYEIILVDDGSSDSSPAICDKYEQQYANIRTVHKKNGGLSDARNVGLAEAKGEYILFVDSDDFVGTDTLFATAERLIKDSNCHIDLLTFGYSKYYNSDKRVDYSPAISKAFEIMPIEETVRRYLFILSAWAKFVRRELLVNANIDFRKGVFSEDIEWCAKLILNCKDTIVLNETAYEYRQRENSITKSIGIKNVNDVENAIYKCIKMETECDDANRRDALRIFIATCVSMYIIAIASSEKESWQSKSVVVKSLKKYLRYSSRIRERIILIILSVIGYKNTLRLLRMRLQVQ